MSVFHVFAKIKTPFNDLFPLNTSKAKITLKIFMIMFRHKTLQSHRIWTRQDENFELRPLSAAVLLHSDQDHSDWCDFALWPRSLRLVWFCTLIKITQTGVTLHSHQGHSEWCDFALWSGSLRLVWFFTHQDHSDCCASAKLSGGYHCPKSERFHNHKQPLRICQCKKSFAKSANYSPPPPKLFVVAVVCFCLSLPKAVS